MAALHTSNTYATARVLQAPIVPEITSQVPEYSTIFFGGRLNLIV